MARNSIIILVVVAMLSLFTLFSCMRVKTSVAVIGTNNMQTLTLHTSDYFESIDYIPLETADSCLIDRNPRVYVVDESIVVIDEQNCFIFDRHTGKWLGKIGIKGRGPSNYRTIPRGLIVNEQDKALYLSQGSGLIEYSLIDPSATPRTFQFPSLSINHLVYVERDLWAVGLLNFRGNNANQIMFYDREGVVDSIPNHDIFTLKTNMINIDPGEILFYRYDDDVYYKNRYNDTIFRITDKKMQPAWIFQMRRSVQTLGKLRGDLPALTENIGDYYLINSILETDESIFYTAQYGDTTYAYLFDKKQNKLTELEHEKFINDIDGGVSFWPETYTSANELVDVWEAFEMKDILTEEYFSTHPAKDSEAKAKLQTLLKNIKENDNPVIMIAKLKK